MRIMKVLFFLSLTLATVLAGIIVYAADQSICLTGANVIFHNDGSLKSCQLKNDYDVNSIQCKRNSPVSFYNNGNLEYCTLSKSASIGMIKCKKDGQISFFINGDLKSCLKPEN